MFGSVADNINRTLFSPLWANGPAGVHLLVNGLGTTIFVTFFAILLGVVLGTLTALLRQSRHRIPYAIGTFYVELIRGTPLMVQLLIIYFVVFGALDIDKSLASIMAFGLNSGAYIAEIIRAGIQAVPSGQMEAARSLGLPYRKAMRLVILPQAVKNILPALGNEFVVLLKETSIIGYIGGNDLMRASVQIRSATYDATAPLIVTAIIYLIITFSLSNLISYFERRMRASD
jgi:polar amino acid transport system permease protein